MGSISIGFPVGIQICLEVWALCSLECWWGVGRDGAGCPHGLAEFGERVFHDGSWSVSGGHNPSGQSHWGRGRLGPIRGVRWSWGGFMSVSALAFALAPDFLARIYTTEADVLAIATVLIPIAAAFQLFDGLQNVVGNSQGRGRCAGAHGNHELVSWGCGLPFGAYLAFSQDKGAAGIWAGIVLASESCQCC